jgi:hypothetical protein
LAANEMNDKGLIMEVLKDTSGIGNSDILNIIASTAALAIKTNDNLLLRTTLNFNFHNSYEHEQFLEWTI